MPNDEPFRWGLICVACVMLPIMGFFFVRSGVHKQKVNRRDEGPLLFFTLRPMAALRTTCVALFMLSPAIMHWASVPLPDWIRWAGFGVAAFGATFVLWTLIALGKNLTDTVTCLPNATLVTTGPYRLARHPFYVGFALIFLGEALTTANWAVALGGALVVSLLMVRTPIEEGRLIEHFGDQYLQFMARTNRYFPRWISEPLATPKATAISPISEFDS